MPSTWVATTSQGRMVGDYISTSYDANGRAHGVFSTASTPTGGTSCSGAGANSVWNVVDNNGSKHRD